MKFRGMLLLMVVVVVLVFVYVGVRAQYEGDQRAGKTVTATGCLSKGNETGEFYLTADDGKRYELRSDKVSLADHVGHTITVTGTTQTESEAEERGEGKENEPAENEAANLQVTNVKMVSSSCK